MTRKTELIKHFDKGTKPKTLRKQGPKGTKANPIKQLKPYALMSMKEKYAFNEIEKIGYLDIETSGLTANFDYMISWAMTVRDVQTGDVELRGSFITPKDHEYARKNRDADLIDQRILIELMEDIGDIDCLIGHWFIGKHRHDIPFVRTRCAINKVAGFPKHKAIRYGDTQKWGSLIHRLSSNGLGMIGDAYGISTKKTFIKTKEWKNAIMFADPKAVKYVYDHNVKDVYLTLKVHKHMEEYVPLPSQYA